MDDISRDIPTQVRILNPNLGHPFFFSVDKKLIQKEFTTKFLCASNVLDILEVKKMLKGNIELVPIFEYKWRLRSLLERERRKKAQKIKEAKKKKLSRRIILRISKKRRESFEKEIGAESQELINKYEEELIKGKDNAIRGEEIKPIIVDITSATLTGIDKPNYDSYLSALEYYTRQEILDTLTNFYTIEIKFEVTEEIIEFLENHNFVMLDIVHKLGTDEKRVNYHSLVISKSDWTTFSFIHATDLHIAERNDSIYEVVKAWLKLIKKEPIENHIKKDSFLVSLSKRFQTKPESIEETQTPLKKRYVNPNNNFRTFIKLINAEVLNNKIEFVVLTGDLIDFAILSTISKSSRKTTEFSYNSTNWKTFKNIVLNQDTPEKRGVIKGEELLCPIFTIPGNHDYRPYHYDLRWGGLYKKIGLKANEALALNDKYLANPITAITKSFRALKGYLSEINLSLDYYLKLGVNNLIFLNTGSDSFRNLRDLLSGKPSVTGLSAKQISFLERLIHTDIKSGENTFLFMHGPPINPKKSISLFKRVGKKATSDHLLTEISQFKETLFNKLGFVKSKARIDEKFNLKFGTISSHWEDLIDFCRKHVNLTLSGHTHELKEFRLGIPTLKGTSAKKDKKLEDFSTPVYYDLYSELFTNAKDIENNAPFIVQTPALGLGGFHNPNLVGGYREIQIKDGKLENFKVKFINR